MKKFFIDYSEDEVLPSGGDSTLVEKYETIQMIMVFDSKEAMYIAMSEFSHQARNGVRDFKEFTYEEMIEKIQLIDPSFELELDVDEVMECLDYEAEIKKEETKKEEIKKDSINAGRYISILKYITDELDVLKDYQKGGIEAGAWSTVYEYQIKINTLREIRNEISKFKK